MTSNTMVIKIFIISWESAVRLENVKSKNPPLTINKLIIARIITVFLYDDALDIAYILHRLNKLTKSME